MAEKYIPSGQLQGDTTPLPYRGSGIGFQGTSHGVDFDHDSTQRLAGADAKSDPYKQCMPHDDPFIPVHQSGSPDFTGSLGRFDGGSAERYEENMNDADVGQRDG